MQISGCEHGLRSLGRVSILFKMADRFLWLLLSIQYEAKPLRYGNGK